MAYRVTKAMLDKQIDWLNKISGGDYCLGWAYGGVRVEAEQGSRDISPRGTKREVSMYLRVMHQAVTRYQDLQGK